MSYIEPNSTIKIFTLNDNNSPIPFDVNMENTVIFTSLEQQEGYMNAFRHITLEKNSYARVNKGSIKVGLTQDVLQTPFVDKIIASVYNANYMAFKNTSFENKWFYCFIDSTEYVNNNTVVINYHIDPIQTYMFDYTFNQCLIEREHTVSDRIGEHTLAEGLETGPYRAYEAECYMEDSDDPTGLRFMNNRFEYLRTVVLATSVDVTKASFPKAYGVLIPSLYGQGGGGEYYSGIRYYSFPITDDLSYINELNRGLDELAGSADADAIVGIFIMPREFVPTNADEFEHGCHPKRMRVMRKETIDTYAPRNKKLFCYPYNELYITNNSGNTAEYKIENFLDPDVQEYDTFSIWGNCSMQPGMYCAPMNYNGVGGAVNRPNFDDEITVSGFPMCSYTIDSFKAWLAQNAGTIMATASDIASDWVSVGVNAGLTAAGVVNPFGNTAQNAMSVMNQVNSVIDKTSYALGALYDHKRRPPQVHGNSNGNLTYQAGQMTFCWYHKQIRTEYAAIIDKFFDMYGYKTNRVGTPNLMARPFYSYVKTIGCSIDGMIPGDMKAAIERIFDKGIRFWMPYASFGNYDPDVNDNRAPTGGD